MRYVPLYNTQLPQSALGCRTPMQAMKDWHKSHPHIFVKSPRNRPGRDSASCPCYYLPSRRGCRFRHDGQGHSRRDPPLAGATFIRVISWTVEIERNRLDRSARRAEKPARRAPTGHRCRLLRAAGGVRTRPTHALAEKCLITAPIQATLPSNGRPWPWEMSDCTKGCVRIYRPRLTPKCTALTIFVWITQSR